MSDTPAPMRLSAEGLLVIQEQHATDQSLIDGLDMRWIVHEQRGKLIDHLKALEPVMELAKAESMRTAGSLTTLIDAKEAAFMSMEEGPAKDMLNDEIIVLGSTRTRLQVLFNRLNGDD